MFGFKHIPVVSNIIKASYSLTFNQSWDTENSEFLI